MLCYYKTDYSELFTLTGEHCCKIAYPEKFTFSWMTETYKITINKKLSANNLFFFKTLQIKKWNE